MVLAYLLLCTRQWKKKSIFIFFFFCVLSAIASYQVLSGIAKMILIPIVIWLAWVECQARGWLLQFLKWMG